MKKVYYDTLPSAIESVGNGNYLYRWSIEEVELEAIEIDELRTLWRCNEVVVGGVPTENSITEAVISALWGSGLEQKLLNDYNASLMGMLTEEYAEPYLNFLFERQACKAQISQDFAQWTSAI